MKQKALQTGLTGTFTVVKSWPSGYVLWQATELNTGLAIAGSYDELSICLGLVAVFTDLQFALSCLSYMR